MLELSDLFTGLSGVSPPFAIPPNYGTNPPFSRINDLFFYFEPNYGFISPAFTLLFSAIFFFLSSILYFSADF